MVMDRIYKNLFFDTETQSYAFINGDIRKEVISQEAYLLIYIIEILKGGNQ